MRDYYDFHCILLSINAVKKLTTLVFNFLFPNFAILLQMVTLYNKEISNCVPVTFVETANCLDSIATSRLVIAPKVREKPTKRT